MSKHIHPAYASFNELDFSGPKITPKCTISDMHPDFMRKLQLARTIANVAFIITSAYRSVDWEKSRNRSTTGAHTTGRAVDIQCTQSNLRFKIVNALLSAGFKRIGIHLSFIHVDDAEVSNPNKFPAPVIFMYG